MKSLKILMVLVIGVFLFAGCASTGKMLDHATLKTEVKMSDTIFLNLNTQERTAYVKVLNTSDIQNIPLEPALKERLVKKGIRLVDNPADATWIIQANIKSLFYIKEKSMASETGVAGAGMGGFLGGVGSALSRSNNMGVAVGAAVGSIIGNVAGAALGALVKIESYEGIVDLQIQEKVKGGVKGKMVADIRRGSTTMTTEREIESEYQTYSTFLNVEAKRTNINLEEAIAEITAKLADQIAGLF
ncbi:MAG TPA: complement resistance protein TraT [Syntrophorhabdaceae bacterium]|nr:complement resistance protein TraT [Syntrophorhabdaceae bacterium]HQK47168.1 complement resistance protein TraT [Syntrophorhabdaceae bacterium]